MRVFLGGVPFGCDNIGDEAILACAVDIFRRNFPNVELTVSTARPDETAKLLNIKAVPLYGFRGGISELEPHFRQNDVFVWTGATGLSDYPALAVEILSLAQKCGLKTVIWGVGMNSELNPAFFKLGGKKLAICKLVTKILFGKIDVVAKVEQILVDKMKKRIGAVLQKSSLVIVRDYESFDVLKTCGDFPVTVGADSALIFDNPDMGCINDFSSEVREALSSSDEKIGVCISAQGKVRDMDSLVKIVDSLLESDKRKMFFIPMNPVTDSALMKEIHAKMKFANKAFVISECMEPKHAAAAAKMCDVIVSSRLHLLILAANVGTPIVGISRGTKVDNFLGNFGFKSAGSVESCDFKLLAEQVENLIKNPEIFKSQRDDVYKGLSERLANAESLLKKNLG